MQNIVLCLTNHMYFENTQALLYHRQLSQCNATNELILHKGKNMHSGAGLYSTCVSWCGCSRHGTTFNWNKERSVQDSLSNVMTLTRQSFVLLRYSKVRAGGQTQTEFWGEWGERHETRSISPVCGSRADSYDAHLGPYFWSSVNKPDRAAPHIPLCVGSIKLSGPPMRTEGHNSFLISCFWELYFDMVPKQTALFVSSQSNAI